MNMYDFVHSSCDRLRFECGDSDCSIFGTVHPTYCICNRLRWLVTIVIFIILTFKFRKLRLEVTKAYILLLLLLFPLSLPLSFSIILKNPFWNNTYIFNVKPSELGFSPTCVLTFQHIMLTFVLARATFCCRDFNKIVTCPPLQTI